MTAMIAEPQLEGPDQYQQTRVPRILIIDDDLNILRCFQRRFKRFGIDLVSTTDSHEGYYLAIEKQPDVVITDMGLPNKNGCWVISRLKGNSKTEHIPVLLLTGLRDHQSERLARFLGAEKTLEKPIRFRELIDQLRPYFPKDAYFEE